MLSLISSWAAARPEAEHDAMRLPIALPWSSPPSANSLLRRILSLFAGKDSLFRKTSRNWRRKSFERLGNHLPAPRGGPLKMLTNSGKKHRDQGIRRALQ
jgi:hypothetical protein